MPTLKAIAGMFFTIYMVFLMACLQIVMLLPMKCGYSKKESTASESAFSLKKVWHGLIFPVATVAVLLLFIGRDTILKITSILNL